MTQATDSKKIQRFILNEQQRASSSY